MTKKLTVVYGGQFGSEGKGQVANHIAEEEGCDFAVRVGGPNAGHTSYHNGHKVVVQSIPSPVYKGAVGIIGPGGLLILDLLEKELIRAFEVLGQPVVLYIDEMAVIISKEMMSAEQGLKKRIASTGEGVGAAGAEKIWRKEGILVRDHLEEIYGIMDTPHGANVKVIANTFSILNNPSIPGHVIVEGTQGVGLSLHTSGFYPKCTSRECTPQGILAEAGINPWAFDVVERVAVIRSFPIRVGGPSGPLKGEVKWEEIPGAPKPEKTTVTKTTRRIARLDMDEIERMVSLTSPTAIAFSFVDYLNPELLHETDFFALVSSGAAMKIHELLGGRQVKFYSTGPGTTISNPVYS